MGWCGIIHSENFPSPIPDVLGDNRFLFSITNAVFVVDLTNVSMVAQNPINMLSVPNPSLLGSNPVFVEFLGNQCRRLNLNESLKDSLDDPCFLERNTRFSTANRMSPTPTTGIAKIRKHAQQSIQV